MASTAARNRGYETPGTAARHDQWPAASSLRPVFGGNAGDAAGPGPTTPRWSAERRRPGCAGRLTPRKCEVAPYERDTLKAVRLPALRRPLASGSQLPLSPRFRAQARRSAGKAAEMRWRPKSRGRDNPGRRQAPREREVLRRARRRSGLFDIVKTEPERTRRASSPGPRPGPRASAIRRRIAAEIDVRAVEGRACGQPTAVQVPSGLRQALPRATCDLPSIQMVWVYCRHCWPLVW